MSVRLRRSEWRALVWCLHIDPWSGQEGLFHWPSGTHGLKNRLFRRGLLELKQIGTYPNGQPQQLFVASERGRAAYLAHPQNWGYVGAAANCHPGRVLQLSEMA